MNLKKLIRAATFLKRDLDIGNLKNVIVFDNDHILITKEIREETNEHFIYKTFWNIYDAEYNHIDVKLMSVKKYSRIPESYYCSQPNYQTDTCEYPANEWVSDSTNFGIIPDGL